MLHENRLDRLSGITMILFFGLLILGAVLIGTQPEESQLFLLGSLILITAFIQLFIVGGFLLIIETYRHGEEIITLFADIKQHMAKTLKSIRKAKKHYMMMIASIIVLICSVLLQRTIWKKWSI